MILQAVSECRFVPGASRPVLVIVAPRQELAGRFFSQTSEFVMRLSARMAMTVGIAGVGKLYKPREYAELPEGAEPKLARCKLIHPVMQALGEAKASILLIREDQETPVPHDFADYERVITGFGFHQAFSSDLREVEMMLEAPAPVQEVLAMPATGIPVHWDGDAWRLESQRMCLVHGGGTLSPLCAVVSAGVGTEVEIRLTRIRGSEEKVAVPTTASSFRLNWTDLASEDVAIVMQWIKGESIRCPFGAHSHGPGVPVCRASGDSLLGSLVLRSVTANAVGRGALLIRAKGSGFQWVFLERGVVPIGIDEAMIRNEGSAVRKRRRPDGHWGNSEGSGPTRFESVGEGVYAIYA